MKVVVLARSHCFNLKKRLKSKFIFLHLGQSGAILPGLEVGANWIAAWEVVYVEYRTQDTKDVLGHKCIIAV